METHKASAPVVYSVREVSQILHTNAGFVYDLIKTGLLPALKLKSLRVRREALEAFLEQYEGYDLSDLNETKTLTHTN